MTATTDQPSSRTSDELELELDEAHPSTAALDGHPIHPAVVPLPIGLLSAAAMSDVAHLLTGERFFSRASRWLLGGGLVSGLVAAAIGLVDFTTIRAARGPLGMAHAGGNAVILAMSALSLVLRARTRDTPTPAAVLTLLGAALLAVTGWLGGELAFRKRVGVLPAEDR
jgi:uncharacterized membrane protein